jgi:membrane-bound ClpP family serine protease
MTFWRFESEDELGGDRPRRLLDQYAHELAEKIRAHADKREHDGEVAHGFIDHETQLQREYAEELANLIDPKAQS